MMEDFDDRRLCPDGSCIGLIGPNGRCKVCGRADDGSVAPSMAAAGEDDDELETETASASDEEAGDAFDDDERELCPDGTCIGVIGSDGKCKVCGLQRGS